MARRRKPVEILSTVDEAFARLQNSYNAARPNRYRPLPTGISSSGSSADYHYRSQGELLRIIEVSRALQRDNFIVGQGVRRLVNNIVQDGFRLDPRTGNTDANALLRDKWNRWAGNPEACDVAGEHNFHAQEKLALKQTIVDGDIISYLTDSGAAQLFEAHRLRTPTNARKRQPPVVHGVELEDGRRRLSYWVTRDDIDPMQTVQRVGEIKKLPARNAAGHRVVLHLYRPDRVTQTRGVSAFAPIVDPVSQGDDLFFAQLVKAKVASCYTVFEEYPELGIPGAGTQLGERTTESQADGSERTVEGIAPGMIHRGGPGAKLTGFSPNVPNAEFFQHVMLIFSVIAVNLDLPVHLLLLDPSQTNFSGWRGAMEQAKIGFRDYQSWFAGDYHTPTYEWQVRRWLAEDPRVKAFAAMEGVDIFGHRWNLPSWPYIEPYKDAMAAKVTRRNGGNSDRRIQADLGRDWNDLTTEIVEDIAEMIVKAKLKADEILAEHPDLGITWRDLVPPEYLNPPVPPQPVGRITDAAGIATAIPITPGVPIMSTNQGPSDAS